MFERYENVFGEFRNMKCHNGQAFSLVFIIRYSHKQKLEKLFLQKIKVDINHVFCHW